MALLKDFALGLITPGGGLLLVVAMVLSSLAYFRTTQRLRTSDWVLAAVFNIPAAMLFVTTATGSHSQLGWIYLVLGYGLGGFGVGWTLGLLLCALCWKLDAKEA